MITLFYVHICTHIRHNASKFTNINATSINLFDLKLLNPISKHHNFQTTLFFISKENHLKKQVFGKHTHTNTHTHSICIIIKTYQQ